MGRPKKMFGMKRIRMQVEMHPSLAEQIDKLRRLCNKSRSDFLRGFLESKLLNTHEYCEFRAKAAYLEMLDWQKRAVEKDVHVLVRNAQTSLNTERGEGI